MSDSAHPASTPTSSDDHDRGYRDRDDVGGQAHDSNGHRSNEHSAASSDEPPAKLNTSAEQANSVETLIDEFHVLIYRYAFRLCGNQADAEDLTQQTFLAAQQNLNQLREPGKARSWLLTICRNRFLKSCRRQQPLSMSATDIEIEKIPSGVKPTDDFDREKLHQVVQDLPDEYRVVVLMFYFEQQSYREIAEQLGVKLGTVMSRLSRAKARLRTVLFPEADD